MAIAIMLYHLVYWHISPLDSSHFLGRLGVYGVSVFFVLSGLSMAIVYSNFFVDKRTVISFFIRRIFRIWPLLWICVAMVTIPSLLKGGEISIIKIFLNLTTLFGFVAPGAYINTGAWSIGNEMFYYALTPILIASYRKNKKYGNALLYMAFFIALFFSFILLDSLKPLAEQWKIYINPFNNLFFYATGVAIYYNFKEVRTNMYASIIIFIISILIFMLYPVKGNQIAIITGFNRIIFSLASIMLVFSFYKFSHYSLICKAIKYPLNQIGIATYGVYLLHPIVNSYMDSFFKIVRIQNSMLYIVFVSFFTIFFAILIYNIFENKIIKYGKLVTSNKNKI